MKNTAMNGSANLEEVQKTFSSNGRKMSISKVCRIKRVLAPLYADVDSCII